MKLARRAALFSVMALVLASCGPGSGDGGQSAADAPCPILADASSVFRHPVQGVTDTIEGAAMACRYFSEDGLIDAGLATFDASAAKLNFNASPKNGAKILMARSKS